MRLRTAASVLVAVSVLGALGVGGWYARWRASPMSTAGGEIDVEVRSGESLRALSRRWAGEGVVGPAIAFEITGRLAGVETRLRAGTYRVDRGWSPAELIDRLVAGPVPTQVALTVPEGYNRWQVADRLVESGILSKRERTMFLSLVKSDGLEGRLFPDTYLFDPAPGAAVVLARLTGRFDAVWAELLAELPADDPRRTTLAQPGPARDRVLNLAALVEKEARTDRDRRLVARVFVNRLAKGMRLQTDPTCVYGADTWREVPHPRYCKDPNNRYSTYVIDGLPPTPIANPGRAALRAALSPADEPEAQRLLYFVARRDGSGEHAFSEDFSAHQRAVTRYLRGSP